MVKLKIPDRHGEGVAAIRQLNDIQASALATQLDGDYGHPTGKSFAEDHEIPGLDAQRVAQIYDTLRVLYAVREEEHLSPEDFANAFIEAMNANGREDLVVPDDQATVLQRRLTKLLSAKGFGIEAKVNSLRRDVEHTYCSSRVITDLRPVFGETVADGPIRMLVIHSLRLAFHDADEHDELYVSLSDANITRLIEQLARAQEKSRLLTDRFVKEQHHEPSRK